MQLPHGRELIGFLPLADLYTDYRNHERLRVFAKKGLECVTCDLVGSLLVISRENVSKKAVKRGSVGNVHIDLYTDEFVLMTVDHIIPKAICRQFNWTNDEIEALSNKQPMCEFCNGGKSDKLISEWDLPRIRAEKIKSKQNQSRRVYGSDIVRELLPNIHALLGDTHENTIQQGA